MRRRTMSFPRQPGSLMQPFRPTHPNHGSRCHGQRCVRGAICTGRGRWSCGVRAGHSSIGAKLFLEPAPFGSLGPGLGGGPPYFVRSADAIPAWHCISCMGRIEVAFLLLQRCRKMENYPDSKMADLARNSAVTAGFVAGLAVTVKATY